MTPGVESGRILLVDDHILFRQGVARIFADEEDLHVVGEADDGQSALEVANRLQPDVVLVDVQIHGVGAEQIIGQMLSVSPSSKIVVLTVYDEAHLVRTLVKRGVHAYVAKSSSKEELLSTIRTILRDEDRVVLSVSRNTIERLDGRKTLLTQREAEILTLVADGLSNAQIGRHLFISEGTVKRHLTNVYAKLGVAARVDAINRAIDMGVLGSRIY